MTIERFRTVDLMLSSPHIETLVTCERVGAGIVAQYGTLWRRWNFVPSQQEPTLSRERFAQPENWTCRERRQPTEARKYPREDHRTTYRNHRYVHARAVRMHQ